MELKTFLLVEAEKTEMVWTCERGRGGVLGEVGEKRVGGQRPAERPRKKWSDCVMEDMNLLGVEEHVIQDRQMWKTVIAHPTPS